VRGDRREQQLSAASPVNLAAMLNLRHKDAPNRVVNMILDSMGSDAHSVRALFTGQFCGSVRARIGAQSLQCRTNSLSDFRF
jgi:hypothetical protein